MISVNSESFGILQKLNDNNNLFMPRPSFFLIRMLAVSLYN